ncbi:MAG: peptide ABC transporter substrate-binding protein [Oscillospiraceae bacterium]|nr:peptide ABC transporter substrate-binding protein [Oscillospiraceae bacterium]
MKFIKLSKFCALSLIPALILFLFTGCSREEDDGTGYLFTCTIPGNPECLDPQYTDNPNSETVLANMMEGLLRLDAYGRILLAGAESYQISEDGLTYEFKLKNNCYWYSAGMEEKDAKPVTARDYVFAFRRLLDPDTHAPHAEDFLSIENASGILNGNQKPETLGVIAQDGGTLIFHLSEPDEEFLMLLTQNCAVPCNEDFFLSTKGRYGLSQETILCNGAFYLTKWAYDNYGSGNFLTFRKNALYHDADQVSPSSLQFTIMRSQSEVDEDFAEKNADCILTTTYPGEYLSSGDYQVETNSVRTWGLIFNPENSTLQNKQFREALAAGIDREANAVRSHQSFTPAYGMIPPAVRFLGRSYRELCADEPLGIPYDPDSAINLFSDLKLPMNQINSLRILIPDTFDNQQALLSICQEWQNLFHQYIGIESVPNSEYEKRLADGDYSIALYSFKPAYHNCESLLKVIIENAEFLGIDPTELNTCLEQIAHTEQTAETLESYRKCEEIILQELVFIPLYYQNLYFIHTARTQDIWCNPFTRAIYFRDAKRFSKN